MAMATLTPMCCSCSTPRFSGQHHQHGYQLKLKPSVLNFRPQKQNRSIRIRSPSASNPNQNESSSPGLYSAKKSDLTASNVDLVLDEARPYPSADGGNVDVVSVEDGVVSLRLEGACESCPSSTTTRPWGSSAFLRKNSETLLRTYAKSTLPNQGRQRLRFVLFI